MHTDLIDGALRSPDQRTDHCAHPRTDRGADGGGGHDVVAVRAWARSRGYPIDESAGVPLVVLETYRRLQAR